ncbi:non-ribosomal peptide synthetase [Pectobacterium actinidiae]|uniref:Non-ribosomal peptide synthetase n=1 Tax=Pectobacterium actinidiae TaxID=1507808 RepID=A0ABW8G8Y5_9GAMM
MSGDNTNMTAGNVCRRNRETANAVEQILHAFAHHADKTALINAQFAVNYTEFERLVVSVQQSLMTSGVKRGDVIGLLLCRDQWLVPSMVAALAMGVTFVPLDPAYPLSRLQQYVEVARPTLLLSHPDNGALARELHDSVIYPERGAEGSWVCLDMQQHDIAYILFTSGSTGQPKGVSIGHEALGNFLSAIGKRLHMQASEVFLAHTTVAFDISILELLYPLTLGGTVLLASNSDVNEIDRLLPLIARSHFVQATPSLWKILLATGWRPNASVTILSGGEALPLPVARKLNQTCRRLWNLYGPTEATIWTSCECVEKDAAFISIGEPLENTQLHVLDEDLQPATEGQLYLSGVGLALGYYGNTEGTASAFFPHPDSGIRIYRSGDRVRMHPQGKLEWLGRGDGEIKIRGNRIGVKEIEHALENLPGIAGAVVAAKPFAGHGDDMLTAYVISQNSLSKAELEQALHKVLPAYMVPDLFVVLATFPLHPNGKFDRKSLPEPTWDNTLHHETHDGLSVHRNARFNAVVAIICDVFSTTLGQADFHETANFFDLGGNSVLAVISAGMIGARLEKKVPVSLIAALESPKAIAEKILYAEQ